MRVIGRNELIINDPFSGSELKVYYKHPTTEDRLSILGMVADAAARSEKRMPVMVEVGRKVIDGYPDGTFGIDGEEGAVAVDSNPDSLFYAADWKEVLFGEGSPNEDVLYVLGDWIYSCINDSLSVKKKQRSSDGILSTLEE